eukprot:72565-Pyramimonas_sp.AAC.1
MAEPIGRSVLVWPLAGRLLEPHFGASVGGAVQAGRCGGARSLLGHAQGDADEDCEGDWACRASDHECR